MLGDDDDDNVLFLVDGDTGTGDTARVELLPCNCNPSNPPIRSKYTKTFSRTSFVNGIYCRIRIKYASMEIRGTVLEWNSVIGSRRGS